ncbi:hypothetical protein BDV95DRAFT_601370 [Massariosphaeria phaeospora]|uniref:Uncharacterized protein n=1 Tax=Massariosphaeria phaeospora TaxID=100035 RepID=A0A7C8IDL5_9PLEO|nr:hypothetical protein BDV95DRAFT_601370 [Massariosphaeria phaeospora]
MDSPASAGWNPPAQPPSPVPSPPPLAPSFEVAVDDHHIFHGPATRLGHRLCVNDSSAPTRDWRLRLRANFLSDRDRAAYSSQEIPVHLLPFFAYKDVALYVPPTDSGRPSLVTLFDAMYQEWYPTRDRTVFDNGLFSGCGAPFFSATVRVDFDGPAPQPSALLKHFVDWHIALSRRLYRVLPRFDGFPEGGPRMLVRPGLTQPQLQALPARLAHIEYTPIMRRTFTECFVWANGGWEDEGVRLVVLGEDMLRRILSSESEGLTRDVDLERQAKEAESPEAETGQGPKEDLDDHIGVDVEASIGRISVWIGSIEHVMRAVLAGDETRKRGLREYNPVLDEWLGEGVNVGK